jgi:hypothetical protein
MRKKTVRKIIYFLVVFPAAVFAVGWVYTNFIAGIDTAEVDRYYDLLAQNDKARRDIVYKLEMTEYDSLQAVADKLKNVMGLGNYTIYAGYGETRGRPALITSVSPGIVTIAFSRRVAQKREQINVLIHELSHIYVWSMDKDILKDCDEEKVVDCAGIFLGLGVPILNGLTDEVFFMPGGEYHAEKKTFGYIKPEQTGYLLARFCDERGIKYGSVAPYLDPAGRRYFSAGHNYLERRKHGR